MRKWPSQYAWWFLTQWQKERLEEERAGGRFGGETGLAVGRAPWFWAQDRGNPSAAISGTGFFGKIIAAYSGAVAGIVTKYMRGS